MKNSCKKTSRYGWNPMVFVRMFSMFLAMLLLLAGLGTQRAKAAMLTQGSENYTPATYQAGDILVGVHIGLNGNLVPVDRYTPVLVTLQNNGKDFSGSFRLYENLSDEYFNPNKVIIEKNVQVAAGETKKYTMLLKREYVQDDKVLTALCNSKGKVLGKKKMDANSISLVSDALPTIGLISEDGSGLSYLKNNNYPEASRLYFMQDFMITEDYRSLDPFDIIVINNFDTSQFSDKQIKAMEEWVKWGGTLIFGTGAQPEKTLKAFSASLVQGSIGNVKQISLEKGGSLEISELNLEGSELLLAQDQDALVSEVVHGDGCVMVASFDLNIGQQEFAQRIQSLFYQNYSANRKKQLQREGEELTELQDSQSSYSRYAVYRGLEATEVSGLPNIVLYAVLLVFYALLIGPILYSILRKKGKREQLWKLIPLLAVVFSVLIYLIGTSTRVKRPYIHYLTQIDLSNPENSSSESFFKLTTPSNHSFDLDFAKNTDLSPYRSDNYYWMNGGDDNSTDYQYGIEYLSKETKLHMDNMAAFDSVGFQEKQEDKTKGRMEFSGLRLDSSNPDGIVSNHTEYDLEESMIVFGDEVLLLGDLKKGESKALKDCPKKSWTVVTSSWIDFVGGDIMTYTNGSQYDYQGYRRAVLLERYGSINESSGYYFYAYLPKEQETVFTKQFDLDLYGETAVVQYLTAEDLKNNAQYALGDLTQYLSVCPQEVDATTGKLYKDDDGMDIKVFYDLSDIQDIDSLQLQYGRMGNIEFELLDSLAKNQYPYSEDYDYYETYMFFGTVSAVNQQSGKSELLITSGQEVEITDLSKYIDKDRILELNYHIERPDSNIDYEYSGIQLPKLTLERRNAQ